MSDFIDFTEMLLNQSDGIGKRKTCVSKRFLEAETR